MCQKYVFVIHYIILYNKSHKVIVEICRKVGEIVEKSLSYKLPEREKEAMKVLRGV